MLELSHLIMMVQFVELQKLIIFKGFLYKGKAVQDFKVLKLLNVVVKDINL